MAELSPAKFKVGDLVTVHTEATLGGDAKDVAGSTGVVDRVQDMFYQYDPDYGRKYRIRFTKKSPTTQTRMEIWSIGENNLKLTNSRKESTTMSNITLDIKLAKLSDTDRLLFVEGIIDEDGEPTSTGLAMAQTKLFEAHKATIVKDVQEAVAKRPQ